MRVVLVLVVAAACAAPAAVASPAPSATCGPTAGRSPGRAVLPSPRATLGEGFRLTGSVRSDECRPLSGARVYAWLAGPDGVYDTAHEGSVTADSQGRYAFETSFPGVYGGAAPHIHMLVEADGHEPVELEVMPRRGDTSAVQDVVLRRRRV